MAKRRNVVKRGNSFRAVVRIAGQKTRTKTFTTEADATLWADAQKHQMNDRKKFTRGTTLGTLIQRFRDEIMPLDPKKNRPGDRQTMTGLAREFADVDLADMNQKWWEVTVCGWTELKGSTRLRKISRMATVLGAAEFYHWDNVAVDWDSIKAARKSLKKNRVTEPSTQRDRRVSQEEIDQIKTKYKGDYPQMQDIIDFAVITGMRLGEICKLEWKDLLLKIPGKPMILVRDRKNPQKKIDGKVPLMKNPQGLDPLAIIKRQPRTLGEARIFPVDAGRISDAFRHCRMTTDIEDLHFHDLRHEAISRLFEQGFSIPQVALVSGHQDWKNLQIYTNLKPESLHDGPIILQTIVQQMANNPTMAYSILQQMLTVPALREQIVEMLKQPTGKLRAA